MKNTLPHEIELYSSESFKTLLEHEVKRSHRYRTHLLLVHLAVEADSDRPEDQHSAEVLAINVLNVQLRKIDIPCKKDDEFLVLMPSTDEKGGRIVCDRLAHSLKVENQMHTFKMRVFIGMASLSGDLSLSSAKLMQQAAEALQYARDHQSAKPVLFSEII